MKFKDLITDMTVDVMSKKLPANHTFTEEATDSALIEQFKTQFESLIDDAFERDHSFDADRIFGEYAIGFLIMNTVLNRFNYDLFRSIESGKAPEHHLLDCTPAEVIFRIFSNRNKDSIKATIDHCYKYAMKAAVKEHSK